MKDITPGRIGRAAFVEPPVHAPNAALMIDFDNVTMGIRSDLQNQLKRLLNSEIIKGKVAVQRAYADWRRYPQYIVPLSEASIDLIFAPAFGSNKKNATDIRLAIDALELVFTRPEIGTFILLSGDSDFSSLVLKLKEYGKYIIGVGIRESSSDLLIQNCDEYYSYTEVTGLTREGDVEATRRDPWELVVEAVMQMKKDDDVMRSDRLKQVMQTLDPTFNEKDAGFSRFSRFVVEASQRGLLTLEKMENGQYAIDVGENANVPPEDEEHLRREKRSGDQPSSKPRRRRTPRRREEPEGERQLTLAEAFELLRQALLVLGAVGEDTSPSDDVRAKMIDLLGEEADPIFVRPRFQRLLRQAHDANVIELAKDNGNGYVLKLAPSLPAEEHALVEDDVPSTSDAAETGDAPPEEKRQRSRRANARKTSKSRGRSASAKAPAPESTRVETESRPKKEVAATPPTSDGTGSGTTPSPRKRNPRFRKGSRAGAPRRGSSETTAKEPAKAQEPAAKGTEVPQASPKSSGAPKVGPRTGSRARPRGGHAASEPKSEGAEVNASPTTQETPSAGPDPQSSAPTPPARGSL